MPRKVVPELLDSLPHQHPDAMHNRRDLRLTNRIVGSHRWLARSVSRLLRPGERVLEIGAGTGELLGELAAVGVAADGLDLWPRPDNCPPACTWHVADVRTFAGYGRYAMIVGNLIFHQFTDGELAALGRKLGASARVILACEPARRRVSQVLYRVIAPLLGANAVSIHDAHVSIAGGFRGEELPRGLGLGPTQWNVDCSTTLLGLYRLSALRRA